MNSIDLIVLVVISLFGIFGYFRGAMSQLISLLALGLAYFFSPVVAEMLTPVVRPWLSGSPFLIPRVSMGLAGFGIYSGVKFAGYILQKTLMNSMIRFANRGLGFVLGVSKGGVVSLILLLMVSWLPHSRVSQSVPAFFESYSYRVSQWFSQNHMKKLTEDSKRWAQRSHEKIKKTKEMLQTVQEKKAQFDELQGANSGNLEKLLDALETENK